MSVKLKMIIDPKPRKPRNRGESSTRLVSACFWECHLLGGSAKTIILQITYHLQLV